MGFILDYATFLAGIVLIGLAAPIAAPFILFIFFFGIGYGIFEIIRESAMLNWLLIRLHWRIRSLHGYFMGLLRRCYELLG